MLQHTLINSTLDIRIIFAFPGIYSIYKWTYSTIYFLFLEIIHHDLYTDFFETWNISKKKLNNYSILILQPHLYSCMKRCQLSNILGKENEFSPLSRHRFVDGLFYEKHFSFLWSVKIVQYFFLNCCCAHQNSFDGFVWWQQTFKLQIASKWITGLPFNCTTYNTGHCCSIVWLCNGFSVFVQFSCRNLYEAIKIFALH